jgi:Na+-translocating ferredoxin:NAD+ oxidoreductase subunit E
MTKTREDAYQELLKGLFRENPIFVQVLGMCPTLAVTISAVNGLAMGGATLFVLVASSLMVSSLRHWIPREVRIATYVVIIATFVTLIDFSLQALVPAVHKELGAFVPLIVVNCVILGRAEAFASKHSPRLAVADALGMGAGFTLSLVALGSLREILGDGALFGLKLFGPQFEPWVIMILPPGGFLTLGLLLLFMNWLKERKARLLTQLDRLEGGLP